MLEQLMNLTVMTVSLNRNDKPYDVSGNAIAVLIRTNNEILIE